MLRAFGEAPADLRDIDSAALSLVSTVGATGLVIAVASGIAAAVTFSTERGRIAVGVAISITTIPAAAFFGSAVLYGDGALAMRSLGVLATNVVVLLPAAVLTLQVVRILARHSVGASEA